MTPDYIAFALIALGLLIQGASTFSKPDPAPVPSAEPTARVWTNIHSRDGKERCTVRQEGSNFSGSCHLLDDKGYVVSIRTLPHWEAMMKVAEFNRGMEFPK